MADKSPFEQERGYVDPFEPACPDVFSVSRDPQFSSRIVSRAHLQLPLQLEALLTAPAHLACLQIDAAFRARLHRLGKFLCRGSPVSKLATNQPPLGSEWLFMSNLLLECQVRYTSSEIENIKLKHTLLMVP